ncbi:MAG: hypothetical protein R3F34_18790 [Planctomycetota bacterium]
MLISMTSQAARSQAGSLAEAVALLAPLVEDGCAETIEGGVLQCLVNDIVSIESARGNSSEVAWAIWAAIVWKCALGKDTALRGANCNDSVVSLLLHEAREDGLLNGVGAERLHPEEPLSDALVGAHWLYWYEYLRRHRGSARSRAGIELVNGMKALLDAGMSFVSVSYGRLFLESPEIDY